MTKWEKLNGELADARHYAADMKERAQEANQHALSMEAAANDMKERVTALERENAELQERLTIRDDLADAVRAIYGDVPVSNWTRKPLRVIRDWLKSVGKQVSL